MRVCDTATDTALFPLAQIPHDTTGGVSQHRITEVGVIFCERSATLTEDGGAFEAVEVVHSV